MLVRVTVLDVGHGTSLVIESDGEVIIIDAGPGSTLQEYLEYVNVSDISHAFISHADADHVNGLNSLMFDLHFAIGTVHVNPDPRGTRAWQDFRRGVAFRKERADSPIINYFAADSEITIETEGLEVEVLAPPMIDWLGGVGSNAVDGPTMDANHMSGIIRVTYEGRHLLLAGGDAGRHAFETLAKSGTDLDAEILLFPHHGGRPGDSADLAAFAEQVTGLVSPLWTVFSIGRGRYENPNPDVVTGVKRAAPETRIMCTQLSRRCAPEDTDFGREHLTLVPALGKVDGHCCAGSLSWEFDGDETRVAPTHEVHDGFIDTAASSPLCRQ